MLPLNEVTPTLSACGGGEEEVQQPSWKPARKRSASSPQSQARHRGRKTRPPMAWIVQNGKVDDAHDAQRPVSGTPDSSDVCLHQ